MSYTASCPVCYADHEALDEDSMEIKRIRWFKRIRQIVAKQERSKKPFIAIGPKD